MPKGKLVALLARHGEIDANQKPVFRGWINEPLDSGGLSEARDAAKKSKKWDIKRTVSSPLARAVETAKCYADVHDLEIEQEGALMPFNTGVFTGLDRETNAEAYKLFLDNPDIAIPNGEAVRGIHKRISDYMKPALKESEVNLTLFVAHSSTAVCLNNLLKGEIELQPGIDEVVAPGGLLGIFLDGDVYSLEILIEEAESAAHGS